MWGVVKKYFLDKRRLGGVREEHHGETRYPAGESGLGILEIDPVFSSVLAAGMRYPQGRVVRQQPGTEVWLGSMPALRRISGYPLYGRGTSMASGKGGG